MPNQVHLIAASALAFALFQTWPIRAQAQNPLDLLNRDPAKAKVSIAANDLPVKEAITKICDLAHAKYRFEANPTSRVTMRMTDVPFEQALGSLLRTDHLDYRIIDGTYVIIIAPPRPLRAAQRQVTISLRKADVRTAVSKMAAQIGADCHVASDVVGNATVEIRDQPFQTALSLLVRASDHSVDLTFMSERTGFYVCRMSDSRVQSRIPKSPVTLTARNQDIRFALSGLFRQLQLNYNLDQSVRGVVSVAINNEPFPTALQLS